MIYDGALAAESCFQSGMWIWCIIIGILIIAWIALGVSNLGKINVLAMTLLLILTLILSKVIFIDHAGLSQAAGFMSFGAAVELSVAMPLSWLPVLADYTREAERPVSYTPLDVYKRQPARFPSRHRLSCLAICALLRDSAAR